VKRPFSFRDQEHLGWYDCRQKRPFKGKLMGATPMVNQVLGPLNMHNGIHMPWGTQEPSCILVIQEAEVRRITVQGQCRNWDSYLSKIKYWTHTHTHTHKRGLVEWLKWWAPASQVCSLGFKPQYQQKEKRSLYELLPVPPALLSAVIKMASSF
jgi:hypothetical protein